MDSKTFSPSNISQPTVARPNSSQSNVADSNAGRPRSGDAGRTPLILQSVRGEAIPRPPVWMMRQAGRYLEEYRAIKAKHSFLEMTKSSELALEVSIQPLEILRVDAAIVFADILTPAEALGFEIDFAPGPVVRNPVKNAGDVSQLALRDETKVYKPVCETLCGLRTFASKLDHALGVIGFAGAPYTMACYLIDQGPIKHFHGTQIFAAQNPTAFNEFIDRLTEMTLNYIESQIESGAQIVQLFDSWGGNLSLDDWKRWSLPSIQRLAEFIRSKGAKAALYVQPATHLLSAIAQSGVDIASVEWRVPLAVAEEALPPSMTIQGNLDPTLLCGDQKSVTARTTEMLNTLSRRTRYIANLGHGILQTTPRESALAFVKTVQGASWETKR